MVFRILISALIFIAIVIPVWIISLPVVALLLLTPWDGRTTIFGNKKWGRANNHPYLSTKGYWQEFNWLALRNPVNNLQCVTLGARQSPYELSGDPDIGDKIKGGFYSVKMGNAWEYYWIKPYGKRCIRARIGWKILNNTGEFAQFVFVINPWKPYSGS